MARNTRKKRPQKSASPDPKSPASQAPLPEEPNEAVETATELEEGALKAQIFAQALGLDGESRNEPGMDKVAEAYQAFLDGNHAAVRSLLAPVLADSKTYPETTQNRARHLIEAVEVDTKSMVIVSACALLFLIVIALVY